MCAYYDWGLLGHYEISWKSPWKRRTIQKNKNTNFLMEKMMTASFSFRSFWNPFLPLAAACRSNEGNWRRAFGRCCLLKVALLVAVFFFSSLLCLSSFEKYKDVKHMYSWQGSSQTLHFISICPITSSKYSYPATMTGSASVFCGHGCKSHL